MLDRSDKEEEERKESAEDGKREVHEGEKAVKEEEPGNFVDLLAADICLALRRIVINKDLVKVAFKKDTEILLQVCIEYKLNNLCIILLIYLSDCFFILLWHTLILLYSLQESVLMYQ